MRYSSPRERAPSEGTGEPSWGAVAQAYVERVSTRRVQDVVQALAIEGNFQAESKMK